MPAGKFIYPTAQLRMERGAGNARLLPALRTGLLYRTRLLQWCAVCQLCVGTGHPGAHHPNLCVGRFHVAVGNPITHCPDPVNRIAKPHNALCPGLMDWFIRSPSKRKNVKLTVTLIAYLVAACSWAQQPDSLTTNEYYQLLLDSIANGKQAPEFAYTDMQGDTVRLSNFKGKLVVIDIWATWCGPCVAEIPALEKLKDKFEDEPIAFLSISVDKDKKAWENYVTENELTDYQLFSGGPTANPIWYYTIIDGREFGMEGYGTGIPQFIIIDTDGVILENQSVRPSDKQFKWNLQDYLDEME